MMIEGCEITGYKAFYCHNGKLFSPLMNRNLKWYNFRTVYQFEIGKIYVEKKAALCEQGFHYCVNVLDVFKYYPVSSSVVCKVTDLSDQYSPTDGIKSCTTKLRIDCVLNGEIVDKRGHLSYFNDGRLHRDEDLPAIVLKDGGEEWFRNGLRHRDGDLPAVSFSNGTQEWYKNGKRHRDGDLPAVEYANGDKAWWREGKCYDSLKEMKYEQKKSCVIS